MRTLWVKLTILPDLLSRLRMSGYIPPSLIYLHVEHRNNYNMPRPDIPRCETLVISQCRWERTLNPVRFHSESFTVGTLRPSGSRRHTIYLSLMKKKTLLLPSCAFNCKLSILNRNGMKIVLPLVWTWNRGFVSTNASLRKEIQAIDRLASCMETLAVCTVVSLKCFCWMLGATIIYLPQSDLLRAGRPEFDGRRAWKYFL